MDTEECCHLYRESEIELKKVSGIIPNSSTERKIF
jgi:hypothetical protein